MKKIAIIGLIAVLVLIAGCGKTTTVKTDEGDTTVTVTGTGADDWCPEGGDWKMTMTGEEVGEASWKVDKLVTSGKYAGLCHVIYTMKTAEEDVKMDYYFSEDGKTGYYEMDVNGQKISQEWHG